MAIIPSRWGDNQHAETCVP